MTAVVVTTSLVSALPAGVASADPNPSPPSPASSDRSASDPIAAVQQEAKRQGKRLEIENLRTETSTTYANPDGKTLHMEMNGAPVRVKRNGTWQSIDTRLVVDKGTVRPRATRSDLALSNGGDTALLTAGRTSDKAGAKTGEAKVSALTVLPRPTLSGNRAEYASAYGPGADLVVTATATGFRQQIVIRQRPVKPLKFRIPLDPPAGFSLSTTTDGKTALFRDTGKGKEKVADISTRLMLDAVAAKGDSGPDAGRVGRATTAVETASGGTALVLVPDAGFLADPAVTYPVTLAATESDWWEPEEDATVDTFVNNAAYPTSIDNQFLDRILVGKSNSGTVRWRSYLRFEDIPADSPLRGAKVQNADLELWNHLSNDCGTSVGSGITVRRITSDWSPYSMTWNNQPSVTSTGAYTGYGAYSPDCTSNLWAAKQWDLIYRVNGIVQKWADGEPNYGVQLTAGNESDSTNWRRYRTTEYEMCYDGKDCEERPHQPLLFVDFEPAENLAVVREYPADQELPASSYADDKQWAATNLYDGEKAPGRSITPQQALEEAAANNRSVETRLLSAYYPDDLTDDEIAEAAKDSEPEPAPGDPVPTPNPDPTPVVPSKVLNANPNFETETAPWTAADGLLEHSTERAHEATASAKLTPSGDASTVTLRSEAGIGVNPSYLHAVSGSFFPAGGDATIQYGVDFFDASGTLITSSMGEYPLMADTWSPVRAEYSLPPNAATAQLRLSFPAGAVTLYADELELLGPEQETSHTISLPVDSDAWIDIDGAVDTTGDTLWAGAWDDSIETIFERTYLKFDASAIAGKAVTDARLELRNAYSYGCGNAQSGIAARQLTSAWTTGTIDWWNQPASTDANQSVARDPVACTDTPPTDTTWTWPVTAIAQSWATGAPNHGLVLRGVDESTTAPVYDRGFHSSRSDQETLRPVLTVTYRDGTVSPTQTPTQTPTAGPDTTPPTVITTSPDDGAEDVDADAQVTVRFSEPVTNARITLTDLLAEVEVRGNTAASADGTQVTFTPEEPLSGVYEARVEGAKDAAGNTLSPYSWYFETAFAPQAAADDVKVRQLRVRGAEVVNDTLVSSTARPYLLANVEVGHEDVEVELAHGDKVIWKGTAEGPRRGRAASVQVPAGKLKDGWTVRWRARGKAGDSVGAWSAWNDFRVDVPQATTTLAPASDMTPDEVKRVVPSGKDEANEVSFTECTADSRARTERGYMKNRFAFCRITKWRATWWKGQTKVAEVNGRILIRIQPKQRAREFEVSKHVWIDQNDTVTLNYPLAFGHTLIDPNDSTNNTACVTLPGGGGMTGFHTVAEWKAANSQEWQISGRYTSTAMEGADKLGSCTYTSQTSTRWPDGTHPKSANSYWSDTVRCDSASYVRFSVKEPGGCVVMSEIPAMVMTRGDENAKGTKFPDMYDHVKKALTPGSITYPLPGGPTFPDIRSAKNIPGNGPRNALMRVPYAPMNDANRAFAKRTCDIEFKGWEHAGKDCDEFPFAATKEGAAYADPKHNYSVWYVPSKQNTDHGLVVKFWFKNNRILTSDIFWVDAQ
ncbi:DNRLRE domain-containing protein [Microbispora sp. H10830]|uniref:DNRLRE domain-containing protein n=1 Tax=Microbispora sp. H10830 TaxID=2729109 RepID=UPI001601F333|nr:DNRLRE domain-containing protein [Microbispora sp. H10830]